MNISGNISSIQTHQKMLDTSANNVANLNTDGFVPGNTPGARSVLTNNNNSSKSQTDIAKEIPNQIIAEKATALNVAAVRAQDEMLGSLLDIKA
ncbi:flagellar basal body protein [bacterium]|nr:flagellar basal body protein [bacterium]MBU1991085.1 flagellar basal body protein [bacterium]